MSNVVRPNRRAFEHRFFVVAVLLIAAIPLLAPTVLGAQRRPSLHVRDGAWVARHIVAKFDSMPGGWVAERNVMDDIWAPLGMRGVNFYAYGGPVAPHAFASRSDPSSPSYQAWFGVYVVVGRKAAEPKMPMRLGALDQRSWLGAMGDPAPAFTLIDSRAIGAISVAGATRPLNEWNADTHSDLGPGATPLATSLGMPPVGDWPRGLGAFHAVRLRGYYTFWYDAARDVSAVVYACAAGFDVGKDRRDNFAALDGTMLRMMRTVRLASAPPP